MRTNKHLQLCFFFFCIIEELADKIFKVALVLQSNRWTAFNCHIPTSTILQGDGWTSLAPPSRRKSDHLYTFPPLPSFPSSSWHDFDISIISAERSTLSHTLTSDNIPCKDWVESKPPATESCSCPSTTVPPDLILCPLFTFVPSPIRSPSLWNFHEPPLLSHETQMWCHTPSWAVSVVTLPWK